MKLIAKVPTRIDLAGGTLDIYPLTELLDDALTVNFGVTLPAVVSIEESKTTSQVASIDLGIEEQLTYDMTMTDSKTAFVDSFISTVLETRLALNFYFNRMPVSRGSRG